jgi:hypothetical protein
MRPEWTEGEPGEAQWEFDFSGLRSPVERPERTERALPVVDFAFRRGGETWLIECKNPEAPRSPHDMGSVRSAWRAFQYDVLLKQHLFPKLYGTFVYLALTERLYRGRVRYIVIIGLTGLDAHTRSSLTDKLQRVIHRIGPKLRHSRHVPVVEVHNPASWNASHPEMRITLRP